MVVPESYSPDNDMRYEFRAWQRNHPNFMTPKIRRLYVAGDVIIEVSEGTGIPHGYESVGPDIFGVSLWKRVGEFDFEQAGGGYRTSGTPMYNQLFNDFGEANAYAQSVQRMIRKEQMNKFAGYRYGGMYGQPPVPEELRGPDREPLRRRDVRVRGHERRSK